MYTRRDMLKIGATAAFLPIIAPVLTAPPTERYPIGFEPFDQATGGIAKGEMLCLSAFPVYRKQVSRFAMDMWRRRNVAVRQHLGRHESAIHCCFPQKSLPEIIRTHPHHSLFVDCLNPRPTELNEVKQLIVEKEIALVFIKTTNFMLRHGCVWGVPPVDYGDHNFWLTPKSTTHEGPLFVQKFSTNLIV